MMSCYSVDILNNSYQTLNKKSFLLKRHENLYIVRFCVGRRVNKVNPARSSEDIANDNVSEMSDLSEWSNNLIPILK